MLKMNTSGATVPGFDLSISNDGLDAFLRVKEKAERESQRYEEDRSQRESEKGSEKKDNRNPLSEIGEMENRLQSSFNSGAAGWELIEE